MLDTAFSSISAAELAVNARKQFKTGLNRSSTLIYKLFFLNLASGICLVPFIYVEVRGCDFLPLLGQICPQISEF